MTRYSHLKFYNVISEDFLGHADPEIIMTLCDTIRVIMPINNSVLFCKFRDHAAQTIGLTILGENSYVELRQFHPRLAIGSYELLL